MADWYLKNSCKNDSPCPKHTTWDRDTCKCEQDLVPSCTDEQPKCKIYFYWEWKTCQCLRTSKCGRDCPKGSALHPDYECKCEKNYKISKMRREREKDLPLSSPLKCFEQMCDDVRNEVFDPNKCLCVPRINCRKSCDFN